MLVLDYSKLRQSPEFDWGSFTREVLAGVADHGCCLVKDFTTDADNTLLIKLTNSLGVPACGETVPEHPLEDDFIYRIEAIGDGIVHFAGHLIDSTTAAEFLSHTDGYASPDPYDVIILHCMKAASHGGESLLIHLDDIMRRLTAKEIDILQMKAYPTAFGLRPILYVEQGQMKIRYNRSSIEKWAQTHRCKLGRGYLELLDRLDRLIDFDNANYRHTLQPEECMVVDNKRMLHGRTAFPPEDGRLLKRVRLHWPKDMGSPIARPALSTVTV